MAPSYKYQKGNRKPMAIKNGDYKIRCSFCGKTEDQVRKLIAGPDGSYICDECVEICSEIIEEEVARDRMSGSDINLMTPMEMKEVLDEYADPHTEKYEQMVQDICEMQNFTTLRYHRLDDLLESIGIDPCNVCTYCFNGKE